MGLQEQGWNCRGLDQRAGVRGPSLEAGRFGFSKLYAGQGKHSFGPDSVQGPWSAAPGLCQQIWLLFSAPAQGANCTGAGMRAMFPEPLSPGAPEEGRWRGESPLYREGQGG